MRVCVCVCAHAHPPHFTVGGGCKHTIVLQQALLVELTKPAFVTIPVWDMKLLPSVSYYLISIF